VHHRALCCARRGVQSNRSLERFVAVAKAVTELDAKDMTVRERQALADMLNDAKPYVQSQVAADVVPALVVKLTK